MFIKTIFDTWVRYIIKINFTFVIFYNAVIKNSHVVYIIFLWDSIVFHLHESVWNHDSKPWGNKEKHKTDYIREIIYIAILYNTITRKKDERWTTKMFLSIVDNILNIKQRKKYLQLYEDGQKNEEIITEKGKQIIHKH